MDLQQWPVGSLQLSFHPGSLKPLVTPLPACDGWTSYRRHFDVLKQLGHVVRVASPAADARWEEAFWGGLWSRNSSFRFRLQHPQVFGFGSRMIGPLKTIVFFVPLACPTNCLWNRNPNFRLRLHSPGFMDHINKRCWICICLTICTELEAGQAASAASVVCFHDPLGPSYRG